MYMHMYMYNPPEKKLHISTTYMAATDVAQIEYMTARDDCHIYIYTCTYVVCTCMYICMYMQMLQEYRDKQKAALETAHLINIWIGEEGDAPKDTKTP